MPAAVVYLLLKQPQWRHRCIKCSRCRNGTNSSPIDAALSNNSKFLYVLTSGNQAISAFAIGNDGSLGQVQVETGCQLALQDLQLNKKYC
jgi:hypothetical protein